MRIDRLDLIAFGPFTNAVLDLSAGAEGLHVVYGPNEAGKSSALRAIRQLFGGIPAQSTDDFVHRHPDMRIGARLRDRSGTVLEVVRRKGNKNTLLRPDKTPLDEAELSKFLGGFALEEFVRKFAIDRDELVAGGKSAAEEHGDLGRMLFAAGASHLSKVGKVLKSLDQEAEALFKKGGSKPRINAELGDLDELKLRIRKEALVSTEWTQHNAALHDALARKIALDRELIETTRERNQLSRVVEALEPIARRKVVVAELAGLTGVPRLAADFTERRQQAESLLPGHERALADALVKIEKLGVELKTVHVPGPLLEDAPRIENLYKRLGVHRKNAEDRLNIEAECAQLNTARSILRDLGRDPGLVKADLESREALRIKADDRAMVEDLANQRQAVLQACEIAEEALKTHEKKLRTAHTKRDAVVPERDPSALKRAIKHAQKSGDLDGSLRTLRDERERLERRGTVDRSALGFGTRTLSEVEELAVPLAETLERFAAEWDASHATLDDLDRRINEREDESRQKNEAIATNRLTGDALTIEARDDAERQRDALWNRLKLGWSDELASEFDQALRNADDAADRLFQNAEKLATHARLLAERAQLARALDDLRETRTGRERQVGELRARWLALWSPLGIDTPRSPKEMLAWLRKHAEIAVLARAVREKADDAGRLQSLVEKHRRELTDALEALGETPPDPEKPLSDLLEHGQEVIEAIAKESKARDKLKNEIENLENERPELADAVASKRADWNRWEARWSEALARIGLPPDTLPAGASAGMSRNVTLFATLDQLANHRLRLAAIDAEAKQFGSEAWSLAERVAPDLVAVGVTFDPEIATGALFDRLKAGQTARLKFDELAARIVEQELAVDTARAEIARLRDTLDVLVREARCEAIADLPALEQQSKRRDELEKERGNVTAQLLKLAAGADLESFVSQAEQQDPDELPSRVQSLETTLAALGLEKEATDQAIGHEKAELKRMDGGALAAESGQGAEDLRARVKADVEQFARLRLASAVLRAGIERYRERAQGPVLRRASSVFSALTLGSFADLQVEADDHDILRLKGVRPGGGEPLGVDAMSIGTADQLYFALRLATLETSLESREPLPLIVDDVLVQFDNARSGRITRAGRIIERTQVLIFTHHEHLVRLAESEVDAALLFTHTLPDLGAGRMRRKSPQSAASETA